MLTTLTGKTYSDWDVVADNEEKNIPGESSYKTVSLDMQKPGKKGTRILFAAIGAIGLVSVISRSKRNKNE